ncbi:MAG: 5-histidylcysteine sulfoxide synthase [Paludibacter sp.]|nr:5-histidylcysteine sulfoxide synthase [Paludibacter sp.]
MENLLTKTIDLSAGDVNFKRQEIKDYFEKTWAIDELLYTQLKSDEVFYHRGDPLRHVLLFYFGHTAVFFINKLFLAKLINTRVNPSFESIFAIGVDEMSWDDLNEKNYNWPAVSEVRAYRAEVKQVILDCIDRMELSLPVKWDDPFWIIMMGIEHERIHLETSSVLIRQLPLDEVVEGRFGQICNVECEVPVNELVAVSGAEMKLGKSKSHQFYGWDNEYGSYTETVADFSASKFLISNAEFLQFVNAGGYTNQTYWTEEGWNWCNYKQAKMPLFWRECNGEYKLRLVAQEIAMPWNWPAEVNYLEAKAFCNWKTEQEGKQYRLLTEAEWYRLAQHCNLKEMDGLQSIPGNVNLKYFTSPCPVDMFCFGDFYDVVGNVWQWTETPITGFAGFEVHPLYDDFSTPTFDGKHNIIKGGSWISTGNEATYHARYAFRRHFYQHAGFRVVQSDAELKLQTNAYETDIEVANSCENSWGAHSDTNFCMKFSKFIASKYELTNKKILDLNANTGRLAFELALQGAQVTALDSSARFIRMPIDLKEKGFIRYIITDEGDLVLYRDYVLSDEYKAVCKNIVFMQDNANNLKPIHTGYDLIVLPELLEELVCPIHFLKNIHQRLNSNGVLIIASSYNWSGGEVQREHWPGGFKRDGEPISSFDGIADILSENFELIERGGTIALNKRISNFKSIVELLDVSAWRIKLI